MIVTVMLAPMRCQSSRVTAGQFPGAPAGELPGELAGELPGTGGQRNVVGPLMWALIVLNVVAMAVVATLLLTGPDHATTAAPAAPAPTSPRAGPRAGEPAMSPALESGQDPRLPPGATVDDEAAARSLPGSTPGSDATPECP